MKAQRGLSWGVCLLVAFVPTCASAKVSRVISAVFSAPPSQDLSFPYGLTPNAPVLNAKPDDRPDITRPTELRGFATNEARVDRLIGPVSAYVSHTIPTGEPQPAGDVIRNFWGVYGVEEDGADSLLGLDVSTGVDNAASVIVWFASPIIGAHGPANDVVLTDFFGDDSVRVVPVDAQGGELGEGVVIASGPGKNNIDTDDPGAWRWLDVDLAVAIENLPDTLFGGPAGPGAIFDNLRLAAVAFDVEDLFGAGQRRRPVAGLKIIGIEAGSGRGTFDLGVVGVNAKAF